MLYLISLYIYLHIGLSISENKFLEVELIAYSLQILSDGKALTFKSNK